MPSTQRALLGQEAMNGLNQIVRANDLIGDTHLVAFFDQGIFKPSTRANALATATGLDHHCDIRPEQDSRKVRGLQLADLVAHEAGTMLLESMRLVTKKVKAGPNSGYDEDMEMEIGFQLWAGIRWWFFFAGPVEEQDPIYGRALTKVGANGLYVSPLCGPELRSAAIERFDECYLGCIH